MRLTLQTDLALRILLYLAMYPDEIVPVRQISRTFQVSEEHAVKVAKGLVRQGLVGAKRGRQGGLRLLQPPSELRLGEVVQRLESLELLGCLGDDEGCPITPACGLRGALRKAVSDFVASLNGVTLADLVANRTQLVRLLGKGARASDNGISGPP